MPKKWCIYGPEPHGKKWRVRLRSPDGEWTAHSFDTKKQAAKYRRDVERQHAKDDALRRAAELYAQADKVLAEAEALAGGEHTVSAAIEAYERYLRFEKQNKAGSVKTTLYRLRALLGAKLGASVASIATRKAQDAYAARAGSGVSAATHRNELRAARSLWGWLVKRGWAVMNPWAEVEPVGRVRAGKEQLRAHEARALDAVALEQAQGMGTGRPRWAEARQEGALAVLVALYLGLRAGEIVGLLARDVGAGELFVADGKTSNAVRRVGVPEPLARLLEAHAARVRARGGDRLFAHRPEWVRDNTRRLCRAAGVPEVCAHSLRGLHATLATEAGATAEAVAQFGGS